LSSAAIYDITCFSAKKFSGAAATAICLLRHTDYLLLRRQATLEKQFLSEGGLREGNFSQQMQL
jgi:four helix bundle suffix protein